MEVEEDASNGIYPKWHTAHPDETVILISSSETGKLVVNQEKNQP